MDKKEKQTNLFSPKHVRDIQQKNPFAKLSDIVYDILADAILSSSIAPGSKLNTTSIATSLGVSTSPVCNAIERLKENGLVIELRSNGSKYRNYFVFDISTESMTNLFVARKAIECLAASICAQKVALIDMAQLNRLAAEFQEAWRAYVDSPEAAPAVSERAKIDREFHRLLVLSTENEYLIDMFDSILVTLNFLSIKTCEFVATEKSKDNILIMGTHHLSICRAIESGFPELASSTMANHLDFCEYRYLLDRSLL